MLYQDSLTAQTNLSDPGALPAPRHKPDCTCPYCLTFIEDPTRGKGEEAEARWNRAPHLPHPSQKVGDLPAGKTLLPDPYPALKKKIHVGSYFAPQISSQNSIFRAKFREF